MIDNGSSIIKAGFGGDEKPQIEMHTLIGRPKHTKVMMTRHDQDFYIGNDVEKHKGLLKLKYPMRHGIVEDRKDMEHVWKQVYTEMKIQNPQEHNVLITEAALNPYSNRAEIAEVFFESFGAPALFFETQAVLSLYAQGKYTGVVCDIGDGVTQIVPVFEGYTVKNAVKRMDLAGRDVTEYLASLIRRQGFVGLHTSAEF